MPSESRGEAGTKTSELCRQNGVSEATYYNWKAKYGGSYEDLWKPVNQASVNQLAKRESFNKGASPRVIAETKKICWCPERKSYVEWWPH